MSEQYLGKGGVVKFCMWTSVHLKDHEGPVGHGAIPFSVRLLKGTNSSNVPCEPVVFVP